MGAIAAQRADLDTAHEYFRESSDISRCRLSGRGARVNKPVPPRRRGASRKPKFIAGLPSSRRRRSGISSSSEGNDESRPSARAPAAPRIRRRHRVGCLSYSRSRRTISAAPSAIVCSATSRCSRAAARMHSVSIRRESVSPAGRVGAGSDPNRDAWRCSSLCVASRRSLDAIAKPEAAGASDHDVSRDGVRASAGRARGDVTKIPRLPPSRRRSATRPAVCRGRFRRNDVMHVAPQY